MDATPDALVHRIEALPGDGRFAVTFRRGDGAEQTAVVQLRGDAAEVAEASLPAGWTRDGGAFVDVADAVRAMHRSRTSAPAGAAILRDPEGGWDVGLGNVVLDDSGVPACTAHGELLGDGAGQWVCAECGARALFG